MTIPGVLVLDGSPVNLLDRVLLAGQTNEEENGIYRVLNLNPTVLVRVADFTPQTTSTNVYVEEGTDLACSYWFNQRDPTLVVNVDPIKFVRSDGGGAGAGTVTGIPPTTIGNLACWADVNATVIEDCGINVADLLALLNRVVDITLTGTAYSTIITETEGSFLVSVKNQVVDGPAAIFSITKNEPGVLPSINTLSSTPGAGSLEVLELQWNAEQPLELRKNGLNYDGIYTVTIFGPGALPSGGGSAGKIAYNLVNLDTRIFDTSSFIIISAFPWDTSTYSSYTNGELTFFATVTGKTFDIRLREVGGPVLTAIPTIVATGSYTFGLTSLPIADSKVVLEVQAIENNNVRPSTYYLLW
jgi:hypothetical protein